MLTGCAIIPTEKTIVRLGAVLSLSGEAATRGLSQQNGIRMAIKEIGESSYVGKGRALEIIIQDSGATPESAVAAINRVLEEEKVSGVLGPTLAAQAQAIAPLAQARRIPLLAISESAIAITDTGDRVFAVHIPGTGEDNPAASPDDPAQGSPAFIAAYEKEYGAPPTLSAAQAYTATWLFALAVKEAGGADPGAIRDALARTSGFDSPLGVLSFDGHRDSVYSPDAPD